MPVADPSHQQLLGNLYREHRGWLIGWLRRSQDCPQRAEDLGQDTFVRLLSRSDLKTLQTPRALLRTIARGLLVDHFRRNALERAYLEELAREPEAEQPDEQGRLMALETLREIDALLGELSPRARSAFLLSRLDGLGHAEIAKQLGVSVARVRQYLAQGMRQSYIALYGRPE